MKNFKTEFSLIKPKLLEGDSTVKAWFTLKNEEFNTSEKEIPGLNLGFNTPEKKQVVAQNRQSLLSYLKLDPQWIAYADQVHGSRTQNVVQGGVYPSTDGLITSIPGLTLAIQVADCAAVLLWDAENKVIGALHAGWRGAVGEIVANGISKMSDLGAVPNKTKAFVSPCISVKHFEVGPEVSDQFPDAYVDEESFNKPHVNLKHFLRDQMISAGIPKSQIELSSACTFGEEENFYSYRREGERSGRMMAIIRLEGNSYSDQNC